MVETVNKVEWGRWELDTTEPMAVIIRAPSGYPYDIELSTCQTLEAQERWLKHMAEKRWITTRDLADLRRAFKDLGLVKEELEERVS